MFKNYALAAIRSIWNNKTYSFLNIFGLAIGIACAALIFLWVEDEKSYDSVNAKKDQIYIVLENEMLANTVNTHASTPGPMAPSLVTDIPGIANACRITEGSQSSLFSIDDRNMMAEGKYADAALFNMFTLPFVQGNAAGAFKNLYSIVITEKTAKKFFGESKDVVGRKVRMDNKQNYEVTGVVRDMPLNSSIQFEWIAPFELFYQNNEYIRKWTNNSLSTYVELNKNADPVSVNHLIEHYVEKRDASNIRLFLFAMPQWHLHWQFENGKATGGGRIQYVHLFSVIAWIILLIACINFMNLATARSEKRARELGVRKVLGAGKPGLIIQFFGEAVFMAIVATAVSVLMMTFLLPAFNALVEKQLSAGFTIPSHIAALALVTLVCGLFAGSYPSLYLSSFNPVTVLKGLKIRQGSATLIRKGLVVVQFSISIVLIIATFIIYEQIQHVKNRDLGFDKKNLLVMDVQGEIANHFAQVKQDLINTGVVENAALSDHETLYGGNNTDGFTWAGKDPNSKVLISTRYVSPEFLATSGMKLLDGRNIRNGDTMANGRINIVVTEALAKMMGKGTAVSKLLWFQGDTAHMANVVGVAKDYLYGDIYGTPDPVVFLYGPNQNSTVMYLRLKANAEISAALQKMSMVMKKDNPLFPFNYRFVDDQFNSLFTSEMLMGKLSRVFASLAIIISCLGLFGLAAYTAERRVKEIGIRKVLGATVAGITGLLSKDFLQLVVISCLVAFPVAWLVMHQWLQNYAYRVEISAWIFVSAAVLAIGIALATVSFQAIRAALANPAKSLKTE